MSLVWKLLRQHISVGQFIGFILANLVGVVIIMLGMQFYADSIPLFTSADGLMKQEYMVISKRVSTVNTLFGSSDNGFSDDEIAEIGQQAFTKSVGAFTSSRFKVYASLNLAGKGVSSDLFFESVPDEYVDVESKDWRFNESENFIPIILPKNYLNLYNFGFSQGRNLPKLSEASISIVPLEIEIWGRNGSERFIGRVVGFSDRLNTILVPEDFMLWANQEFGVGRSQNPARLIVEVQNPADKTIAEFFQKRGYESENGALDLGKIAYFLRLIVLIVISIGLVISVLSFYILMLSIYLLLEKNITKLENLLLLGYSPEHISMPYQLLTIVLNLAILVVSILVVWSIRMVYMDILVELYPQVESGSLMPAVIIGGGLFVLVSVVNIFTIRMRIKRIWRG